GGDTEAVSRTLGASLQELDAARAELRRRSPRAARVGLGQPLGLTQIQAALGDDEILLEYHLADPHSHLFVVGRHSFERHQLPPRSRIFRSVRLFASLASGVSTDEQSRADLMALGHRLYTTLVA